MKQLLCEFKDGLGPSRWRWCDEDAPEVHDARFSADKHSVVHQLAAIGGYDRIPYAPYFREISVYRGDEGCSVRCSFPHDLLDSIRSLEAEPDHSLLAVIPSTVSTMTVDGIGEWEEMLGYIVEVLSLQKTRSHIIVFIDDEPNVGEYIRLLSSLGIPVLYDCRGDADAIVEAGDIAEFFKHPIYQGAIAPEHQKALACACLLRELEFASSVMMGSDDVKTADEILPNGIASCLSLGREQRSVANLFKNIKRSQKHLSLLSERYDVSALLDVKGCSAMAAQALRIHSLCRIWLHYCGKPTDSRDYPQRMMRTYRELLTTGRENGLDSAIEAFYAGVPLQDILVAEKPAQNV